MNTQQRTIVKDFIDLHNRSVKKYLRDSGMLNNNGTLPLCEEMQARLESWFVEGVHAADFDCVGCGWGENENEAPWFIKLEINDLHTEIWISSGIAECFNAFSKTCRCCGKQVFSFDQHEIHTKCIKKHFKHASGVNNSMCKEFKEGKGNR